jgi:hypothetical protein
MLIPPKRIPHRPQVQSSSEIDHLFDAQHEIGHHRKPDAGGLRFALLGAEKVGFSIVDGVSRTQQ